jgi:hypothetical protein
MELSEQLGVQYQACNSILVSDLIDFDFIAGFLQPPLNFE